MPVQVGLFGPFLTRTEVSLSLLLPRTLQSRQLSPSSKGSSLSRFTSNAMAVPLVPLTERKLPIASQVPSKSGVRVSTKSCHNLASVPAKSVLAISTRIRACKAYNWPLGTMPIHWIAVADARHRL